MKFGDRREVSLSLARLLVMYIAIRVLEAAWIEVVFGLVSIIGGPKPLSHVDAPTVGDALSGGLTLARYYYFAFGYAITSAVVFLVSWAIGYMRTARGVAITNLSGYLAHSIVVIAVAFDGVLTPALWTVWILAALYNGLVPARLAKVVTAWIGG